MSFRAFTLIEVLVAMFFLSIALLSLIVVNQSANRGGMDAYYEFMALSLAKEPIEVFRGMGFAWLQECADGHLSPPTDFPLGDKPISDSPFGPIQHPSDARMFQRAISLERVKSEGQQAIRISVVVGPSDQNKIAAWLSRNQIRLESLVFEKKP